MLLTHGLWPTPGAPSYRRPCAGWGWEGGRVQRRVFYAGQCNYFCSIGQECQISQAAAVLQASSTALLLSFVAFFSTYVFFGLLVPSLIGQLEFVTGNGGAREGGSHAAKGRQAESNLGLTHSPYTCDAHYTEWTTNPVALFFSAVGLLCSNFTTQHWYCDPWATLPLRGTSTVASAAAFDDWSFPVSRSCPFILKTVDLPGCEKQCDFSKCGPRYTLTFT